jgi:hypothetical protein
MAFLRPKLTPRPEGGFLIERVGRQTRLLYSIDQSRFDELHGRGYSDHPVCNNCYQRELVAQTSLVRKRWNYPELNCVVQAVGCDRCGHIAYKIAPAEGPTTYFTTAYI